MEDVTTPSASEARAGLANLLKIVGEGPVQVNRKHQDHLDAVFVIAWITMASNGYIDVKDDHVATGRRLLILPFEKSFEHAMDQTLRDQIAPEAAGIALGVEGLRRSRSRGHFCTPPSMEAALASGASNARRSLSSWASAATTTSRSCGPARGRCLTPTAAIAASTGSSC